MNNEFNDLYTPEGQDLIKEDITQANKSMELGNINDLPQEFSHASINPAVLGYAGYKALHSSTVREFVGECKDSFKEKVSDTYDAVKEYLKGLAEDIKEFSQGVYESVKSYFEDTEKVSDEEYSKYPKEFSETREFGLERCAEAAKEYFNPGVINDWMNLSTEQRAEICYAYADEVAKAFELEKYGGVIFEEMEPNKMGFNNGDGTIHLSMDILNPMTSPLSVVDVITHELRHQYQSECVLGFHDVPDEVRNEWAVSAMIYSEDSACCYDPWGYIYNPLEIDSRYAGETVVREISNQMFNEMLETA